MKNIFLIIVSGVLLLSGCSGADIASYKGREPQLDVREFFDGHVVAQGIFLNRSGMVEDQFTVDMQGEFDEKGGTLHEKFTYTDGKTDTRTWKIQFNDEHHFTGTAGDVIGESEGTQYGNAVNMLYTLRVPVKDTSYDLSLNDWLWALDEKTVMNKIVMRKFGFKVGEILITFRKS